MIERVTGDVEDAAALTAGLTGWYLDWAGAQQVARGRFTPAELPAVLDQVRQHLRDELPAMLGPRGRLLIHRQDEQVTGMVGLKPVDAAVGEVKRMVVDPAFQGRGIARDLLERLIADARAEGYGALRLETVDFMTSAHALYRSVGFRDVPAFDGESATLGMHDGMHFLELSLRDI